MSGSKLLDHCSFFGLSASMASSQLFVRIKLIQSFSRSCFNFGYFPVLSRSRIVDPFLVVLLSVLDPLPAMKCLPIQTVRAGKFGQFPFLAGFQFWIRLFHFEQFLIFSICVSCKRFVSLILFYMFGPSDRFGMFKSCRPRCLQE